MAERGGRGPLTKIERERVLAELAVFVFEEGITNTSELGRRVGITHNSVRRLLKLMHERAATEGPSPADLRRTYLAQSNVIYQKAMAQFESAIAAGDRRNAAEFIRIALQSRSAAAKIAGVEDLAANAGQNAPKVRVTFESWEDGAPAAVLAGIQRISAASDAGAHAPERRALPGSGMRSAIRKERDGAAGAVPVGDVDCGSA